MKKVNLLESTETPDGTTLGLYRHDENYTIRLNGIDIMSTREHDSEVKLGVLGTSALENEKPRILIGGLGFGFTLRAALGNLSSKAEVHVVELLPAVIRWNHNSSYPFAFKELKDKRVKVHDGDVLRFLEKRPNAFDRILLDIDNGPSALTVTQNGSLYGDAGIQTLQRSLREPGQVAVWSSADDPRFVRRLEKQGFVVRAERSRAHQGKGANHWIYLADRKRRHLKKS